MITLTIDDDTVYRAIVALEQRADDFLSYADECPAFSPGKLHCVHVASEHRAAARTLRDAIVHSRCRLVNA